MHSRTLRLVVLIAPIVVCACGWLWWPHAEVSASIQDWVADMEVYPDHYSTPVPGGEFHIYLPAVATE